MMWKNAREHRKPKYLKFNISSTEPCAKYCRK